MKISIVTAAFNSADTILDTINSVASQNYPDKEHIVVDGGSHDGTVEIIQSNISKISQWKSEPDRGIYDAMNKGIKMTSGEIVGTLNSDDFYFDNKVLSAVAEAFQNKNVDAVFGDLVFVHPDNLEEVVRRYSSRRWHPKRFAWGYMPAHPTFFVRRKFYEEYGLYKTNYKISADYELLIRFLYVFKLRYRYMNVTMVKMRLGGASSKNWRSNVTLNQEILMACKANGIYTNNLMIYSKYFTKVFELI